MFGGTQYNSPSIIMNDMWIIDADTRIFRYLAGNDTEVYTDVLNNTTRVGYPIGSVDSSFLQHDNNLYYFYDNNRTDNINELWKLKICSCIKVICSIIQDSCQVCDSGFFGLYCNNSCTCINGTCNDNITGDGTCVCNQGFYGINCDKSLSQLIFSNNVTISNQTLTNLTISGSNNITFSGTSVITGNTNIVGSTGVLFTGNTSINGNTTVISSSLSLTNAIIQSLSISVNSTTIYFNNSELIIQGDLNVTSANLYLDSESTISVTNCLYLTNTIINTDLSKLNLIKGGSLNLVSINSGCSHITNTSFIYSNPPPDICPRYQTSSTFISLFSTYCSDSNILIVSSLLFLVGLF